MPDKKKVIIIGSAYPLRGGLSNYNERLAREFMARGYDTRIETFKLQYPNILFPGKSQYSSDPPPKDLHIDVSINSINPINWIRVGNKLRKEKPDLVIIKFWLPFMGPCFGTLLKRIKKNGKTRIISIIDNIIPHEKRPGDHMLASYFVKQVDGFIAMSKSVLNDLNTFDKQKPKLYNPHPLYDNFGGLIPKIEARKKLGLNKEGKIILFFGFIRDYKGLDILLKAMKNEAVRQAGIKLLVAGEFYTNSKPYYDLIDELDIRDQVIMSNDFIPDSKVADYFCASDVVVQPYKSATQSGVTQIAYHFDKPMITTDVGGLAEIVPDGKVGYVVNPDENEIANAILKFYEENKEEEFVSNVKTEKEKYSWGRMLDAILKV